MHRRTEACHRPPPAPHSWFPCRHTRLEAQPVIMPSISPFHSRDIDPGPDRPPAVRRLKHRQLGPQSGRGARPARIPRGRPQCAGCWRGGRTYLWLRALDPCGGHPPSPCQPSPRKQWAKVGAQCEFGNFLSGEAGPLGAIAALCPTGLKCSPNNRKPSSARGAAADDRGFVSCRPEILPEQPQTPDWPRGRHRPSGFSVLPA